MNEKEQALWRLIEAVRVELNDKTISYTLGDRSVTYYGNGLGELIAAVVNAEKVVGPRPGAR